jgi:hypothetical protein
VAVYTKITALHTLLYSTSLFSTITVLLNSATKLFEDNIMKAFRWLERPRLRGEASSDLTACAGS